MKTLNFIELIEKNPITRLNKDYQNNLIKKIENNFTESQQQLFLTSFFCYLNYDNKKDFIIDFDNVWKWCGFSTKGNAKKILNKHFIIYNDYNVQKAAYQVGEAVLETVNGGQNKNFNFDIDSQVKKAATEISVAAFNLNEDGKNLGGAGQNKETILLTVNTFKKFCLKAGTKKADEIHDYYIKLEELLQETLSEENTIIKNQLIQVQKDKNNIEEQFINTKEQYNRLQENHKRILYKRTVHKLRKGKCFYILENTSVNNEKKIGTTTNLNSRRSTYNTYFDPNFLYIIFTKEFKLIEKLVKIKFKNNIKTNSDEWIINISENIIITFVEKMCKELEIEYETFSRIEDVIVDSEKELSSINEEKNDELSDEDLELELYEEFETNEEDNVDCVEIIYTKEKTKKCRKCLETKKYDEFNKDKTKKDGYHTTCKECEKETKRLYKENKLKDIQESNLSEKECSKCNKVQPISEYTIHLYMKDGYCSNCKTCSKIELNSKRKINKDNAVSYVCDLCDKSYSRKDTFNRHKKTCSSK